MSFLVVKKKKSERIGLVREHPRLGVWSSGSGLGPAADSSGLVQATV